MEWALIISISFVVLINFVFISYTYNLVPRINHFVGGGTQQFESNASSSCTFCKILNEPDLVVTGTGGNTCGSIKVMAAGEVDGSDMCASIQKKESVCCRGPGSGPNSTSSALQTTEEDKHYMYMWNQRITLLNKSSVIDMGFSEREALPSRFLQQYFGDEIELVQSLKEVTSWNNTKRKAYMRSFTEGHGDLLYGGLCDTIFLFRWANNGVRRHVLISQVSENWGAFSTHVPDRTADWYKWEARLYMAGCTTEDVWWYLNHTNVTAVFTTTHQVLDHPKVLSLPLGVKKNAAKRLSQELTLQGTTTIKNRTELLLIAISDYRHRPLIAKHVIANFNGTIQNKYKDGSDYWENLRSAKYTLCPGGLGWDTYRAWEAMVMGSIPVLETYYREDGFYHVFDDLPVLWVDHFDNVTPFLLESSYPKILARAEEYNFAKLTKQWWVNYINSFRFNSPGDR